MANKGVVAAALPAVRALHALVEAPFYPLDLAKQAAPLLESLAQTKGLEKYDKPLRRLVS